MNKFAIAGWLIVILLIACKPDKSSTASQYQSEASVDSNPAPDASSGKPDVMKFTKREVIDREGTGMVASTFLLPSDWTVQDKLYWEYRDPTVPIRFQSLMQNPDKSMSIQIFPDVRASWYTGPSGTGGYRPPSDIISGMKDLIKQERKGKDIRFISQKMLANDAQQNGQTKLLAQTGVIGIEYDDNGQTFEEEFYGRLDVTDLISPTVYGNSESIIWGASSLFSCKSPKGQLESARKIAETVSNSARLTKPFYNKLSQVLQLLSNQVYARIYQAGQISKLISQTNDQMIANIDASYQQSQQSADRINDQFSDYMRGVDRYGDGGSEIQLPSGYSNAWVNDRGEYILTNATGYDPGQDYAGTWKQLQKN